MIAAGFAQNGAKVYIAARKEGQLKEVSLLDSKQEAVLMFHGQQALDDLNKSAIQKVQYIVANVGVCDVTMRQSIN